MHVVETVWVCGIVIPVYEVRESIVENAHRRLLDAKYARCSVIVFRARAIVHNGQSLDRDLSAFHRALDQSHLVIISCRQTPAYNVNLARFLDCGLLLFSDIS